MTDPPCTPPANDEAVTTPATPSGGSRPVVQPRASFGSTADLLTSPKAKTYNPHPYGAITTSSGTLTRTNSVPSSPSWVPTHRSSRSLGSMDQHPRPLPIPPSAQTSPTKPTGRLPPPRAHRRSDSLPCILPAPISTSSGTTDGLSSLPRNPAQWTHAQLLKYLEVKLREEGLARPVVQDVLAWLDKSRTGTKGERVGGLALDGREFLKGESGGWAKTDVRPPFHSLLFQLAHQLRSMRLTRQASTVFEDDDEDVEETSVKRLVRGWEERSSSSASETGSDDDDGVTDVGDALISSSARRSRQSERLYRRRSSLKSAEVELVPVAARMTASSSGGCISTLSTPPPPPYAFDSAAGAITKDIPTPQPVKSINPVHDGTHNGLGLQVASADLGNREGSPIPGVMLTSSSSDQPLQHEIIPSSTATDSDGIILPSTLTKRQRKSYEGLGSSREGIDVDGGNEREQRRILTVKPNKSSAPPPSALPSFAAPEQNDEIKETDVARLQKHVATLSDRMRALEDRLNALEAAAAPHVSSKNEPSKDEPLSAKGLDNSMSYLQLPVYLCFVGVGAIAIAWGVIARGKRGRA